jgi:radical SAM protein with 4Fe4S-binding SPASM domain
MISLTKLLGAGSYFDVQAESARRGYGPVVVWKPTRTCNLECVPCLAGGEPRRFAGELSTEEAERMIEDLAGFNVPALILAGGEPLTRPDILGLIDFATSLGLRTTLSTNGTLLDSRSARHIASTGMTDVHISLAGGEERHDRMRGRSGAFRDALRGLHLCREARIPYVVHFTVTRLNIGELGEIFRIVEEENIARLCIDHLVYAGGDAYLSAIDLGSAERRAMLTRLIEQVDTWEEQGREVDVMTDGNDADGLFVYLRLVNRNEPRAVEALRLLKRDGGNRSGMGLAAIDSFGFVYPDAATTNHSLGSIRERQFSWIWRDTRIELLRRLRDRRKYYTGRCASCTWAELCGGNCRARAEAATGDYWASDPACYLRDCEVVEGDAPVG